MAKAKKAVNKAVKKVAPKKVVTKKPVVNKAAPKKQKSGYTDGTDRRISS